MSNKTEGIRRKRIRPKTRWTDYIEGDLKTPGIVNWRRKALKRNDWRKFLNKDPCWFVVSIIN